MNVKRTVLSIMTCLIMSQSMGCEMIAIRAIDDEAMRDDICIMDVNPDPHESVDELLEEIDARGLEIDYWGQDHGRSQPGKIKLPKDFWTRTPDRCQGLDGADLDHCKTSAQSGELAHELVHDCQREMSPLLFDQTYFTSALARLRAEMPAWRQDLRNQVQQLDTTLSCDAASIWIDNAIDRMEETYHLGLVSDLDAHLRPIFMLELPAKCQ